ncbi:MAG: FGGY-family carbohydrate kinase [Bacteroidota bacterium]
MNKYVIAHDVGTSSIKTALINAEGEVIAHSTSPYSLIYPQPGWAEQSPEDYWNGSVINTRKVLDKSKINRNEIIGIVFSTQAMGIIPVDKAGKHLRNNITWVDGRAEEEARWIMNLVGGKSIFKKIIGIEITGKDVLPKLRWLKYHEPDIYRQMDKVLDVNAYLKFRATGKQVFEWSGACSYVFDLKKKDWDRLLFKLIGFDLKKIPYLVCSTDVVGTLTKESAAELDLPENIKVFGGCDDTQSAAIGSGSTGEGESHIYLGTSAWAGITTQKNLKHKNGAVILQSAAPDMNLLVGVTESAGANLEWLIEKFYKYEKNDPAIKNIYEFINKETEGIPAGSEHLIFTPWMFGERCPVSTTTTRGTVFNLGPEHTRGHFVNALLEGVAFNLRWVFENYKRDFGLSPSKIRAIGGGSVNDQWMQGIANITGKTVETLTQPTMAGALGAAACVFVGSGHFKSFHDINKIIQVKKTFIPDPTHSIIFDKLFKDYKNIFSALEKTYIIANAERFIN